MRYRYPRYLLVATLIPLETNLPEVPPTQPDV